MKKRIWKRVPAPFNKYSVSSFGEVVGPRRKILSGKVTWDGYREITLSAGDTRRSVRIHVLVGELFLEDKPKDYVINHKNCNKLDNNVDNLEYVSNGENIRHAYRNGCIKNQKASGSYLSKEDFESIKELYYKNKPLKEIREKYNLPCSDDYLLSLLRGERLTEISGFSKETYRKRSATYITPWGVFNSSKKASEHKDALYSKPSILKFCKNPELTIQQGFYKGAIASTAGFGFKDIA